MIAQPDSATAKDRQTHLWFALKKKLTASDGAEFFELSVKDFEIPGGALGLDMFDATVVSINSEKDPKTIFLAVTDTLTPEAALHLNSASHLAFSKGDKVEFSGVAESFTFDPFMLTFQALKLRRSKR